MSKDDDFNTQILVARLLDEVEEVKAIGRSVRDALTERNELIRGCERFLRDQQEKQDEANWWRDGEAPPWDHDEED